MVAIVGPIVGPIGNPIGPTINPGRAKNHIPVPGEKYTDKGQRTKEKEK
jgi:hypothetical protein